MDKPKDTTLIKWSSDTRQFNITHLVRGCSKNKQSTGLHGSSVVKNLPAMQKTQETQVGSLSQKDSMEKEVATYFSILAWKLQGQGILEGYSPQGRKESDTTERTHAYTHTHTPHLRESPQRCLNLVIKKKTQIEGSSTKQLTIKIMKRKGKLRKCCRLKETKETWQLNATCESEVGPFAIITLLAQLKKLDGISALSVDNRSVLTSGIWWLLWLPVRMFLPVGFIY